MSSITIEEDHLRELLLADLSDSVGLERVVEALRLQQAAFSNVLARLDDRPDPAALVPHVDPPATEPPAPVDQPVEAPNTEPSFSDKALGALAALLESVETIDHRQQTLIEQIKQLHTKLDDLSVRVVRAAHEEMPPEDNEAPPERAPAAPPPGTRPPEMEQTLSQPGDPGEGARGRSLEGGDLPALEDVLPAWRAAALEVRTPAPDGFIEALCRSLGVAVASTVQQEGLQCVPVMADGHGALAVVPVPGLEPTSLDLRRLFHLAEGVGPSGPYVLAEAALIPDGLDRLRAGTLQLSGMKGHERGRIDARKS